LSLLSLFLYLYFSKAGRKDRGIANSIPNLFERSLFGFLKARYGSGFGGEKKLWSEPGFIGFGGF
jgi:hypothetical protein